MKRLLGSILSVMALVSVARADNLVYSGVMISTNGLTSANAAASTATYTMDVNNSAGDIISAQINYSSAVIPNVTFTDGSVSTFTLTVVSTQGIVGIKATNTITITNNSAIGSSAAITLNGITYKNGEQWQAASVSSNTAISIKNAINNSGGYGVIASTTSSTVITLTAVGIGTYANAFTLSSNVAALTAGGATFSGGQNAAVFSIKGVFFTAGVDYAIGNSTATTALNIAAAINANSSLNTLVVSSAAVGRYAGIVYTTGTVVASGYAITTSTHSALTIAPFTSSSSVTGAATGTMYGGAASAYTIQTPVISVTNHGLSTGYGVWFSTGSGFGLSPLAINTTYYAISVDANNFKLASTQANALDGTAITLTSSNTSTTAHSFTLNTIPLTGISLFQLQASNDGINWLPYTLGRNGGTISFVSFATPFTSGSTLWDIGSFGYRYLRMKYFGPTFGGVNFSFYVNQKSASTAR